jgi:hypothetical protein
MINYEFHFDGKIASWKDIEALYANDSKLPIRLCPKLTDKHMHPNGFQKMKVKYATQVLSHTVSAAISTYVSLGKLPSAACGTAELLMKLDKTFDCLNSSSLHSPKVFRRAMTPTSPHGDFMQEMFDFIPTIKVINKENKDSTNLLKCLNALRVTLNGTLKLWSQLQKESVKFLLTRRLNQDPLENFFGSIRQQGGNADNPTPIQFCRAFRKLFYSHFLEQSSGNCAEDVDKILVQLHPPPRNNSSKENQPLAQDQPFVVDESDYRDLAIDPDQSNSGGNAITYVAGYIITKCFHKHKCDTCVSNLVNDELDSSNKLFCYFKGYDSRKTLVALLFQQISSLNTSQQLKRRLFSYFQQS